MATGGALSTLGECGNGASAPDASSAQRSRVVLKGSHACLVLVCYTLPEG